MSVKLRDNIYLGFVVAGSSKGEDFCEDDYLTKYRPRFGRNWWYWLPDITTNGGGFKSDMNTDVNLHWLCFGLSLTVYSWNKEE